MHVRARMRYSNKIAIKWMLSKGFDQIWLKRHVRRHDFHYTKNGNYVALDLWNLFGGICWYEGKTVYIQIKTNGWADDDAINGWLADKAVNTIVLVINVKKKPKKQGHGWIVANRFYWKMIKNVRRKDIGSKSFTVKSKVVSAKLKAS